MKEKRSEKLASHKDAEMLLSQQKLRIQRQLVPITSTFAGKKSGHFKREFFYLRMCVLSAMGIYNIFNCLLTSYSCLCKRNNNIFLRSCLLNGLMQISNKNKKAKQLIDLQSYLACNTLRETLGCNNKFSCQWKNCRL